MVPAPVSVRVGFQLCPLQPHQAYNRTLDLLCHPQDMEVGVCTLPSCVLLDLLRMSHRDAGPHPTGKTPCLSLPTSGDKVQGPSTVEMGPAPTLTLALSPQP